MTILSLEALILFNYRTMNTNRNFLKITCEATSET